jgi:hypothetical protein
MTAIEVELAGVRRPPPTFTGRTAGGHAFSSGDDKVQPAGAASSSACPSMPRGRAQPPAHSSASLARGGRREIRIPRTTLVSDPRWRPCWSGGRRCRWVSSTPVVAPHLCSWVSRRSCSLPHGELLADPSPPPAQREDAEPRTWRAHKARGRVLARDASSSDI